jgi:acyl-CoA thioesterase-1
MNPMRLSLCSLFCFAAVATLLSGCGGGSSRKATDTDTDTDTIRVACVGDSITAGAGTTSVALYSYPTVLAKRLGSGYHVRNFGVSGTTAIDRPPLSYRSEAAYTNALAFKPDIVIIGLGTNDAGLVTTTIRSRFESDYTTLVNSFTAAQPGVKVYICRPPAFNPAQSGTQLQAEILPLIPKIAASTGATVIDLYGPTESKPNYFSDQVHPNNEGAAVLADVVYNSIK